MNRNYRLGAILIGSLLAANGLTAAAGASDSKPAAPSTTPSSTAASDDATVALDVTAADLSAYLAAYPKMTVFMAKRGAAMEASGGDPTQAAAAQADLQAEFQASVGVPFTRFFELHSAVSAAFAEAMADRSRQQQKKSIADSIAEIDRQLADKAIRGEIRADLERQVGEMKAALKETDQPLPPDPALSAATRASVHARLDDLEKAFSQQVFTGEK
ncbi:MAG: hypothetical protein HY303_11505 [Candidatus Wallbacteria bacterium]|nr:hypothetical protein [Candidatus Wallbacteria bacterium]